MFDLLIKLNVFIHVTINLVIWSWIAYLLPQNMKLGLNTLRTDDANLCF